MGTKQIGVPAGNWEALFKKAGVETDRLDAAKSEKARTTILGNFLAQNVGREVPIEVKGRTGKATLRMNVGRGRQKHYHFEIRWDDAEDSQSNKLHDKVPDQEPAPTKTKGHADDKTENRPAGGQNTTAGKAPSRAVQKTNRTVTNRAGGSGADARAASQVANEPEHRMTRARKAAQSRPNNTEGNSETWN